MEIRFVKPEEVQQLARNVQTAFPSKTPQALLDNMPFPGRYAAYGNQFSYEV